LFDDPEFARSLDRQPVFAEKNNFLRDLRTDEPGQQHHDDACAELQFRLAKERRIARNGHVAGKAELERAGKARTANRCNGRLRAMPEAHDRIEILAQNWLPLVEAGRPHFHLLLKVEARGEGLACTGNHDDAHRRVPFSEIHGAIDFLEHAAVERVGARRTRQRQMRNAMRNPIGDRFKVQLFLALFCFSGIELLYSLATLTCGRSLTDNGWCLVARHDAEQLIVVVGLPRLLPAS